MDMSSYSVVCTLRLVFFSRACLTSSSKPGLEMAPKPFSCNIVPRVKARAELIRAEFEAIAACGSE